MESQLWTERQWTPHIPSHAWPHFVQPDLFSLGDSCSWLAVPVPQGKKFSVIRREVLLQFYFFAFRRFDLVKTTILAKKVSSLLDLRRMPLANQRKWVVRAHPACCVQLSSPHYRRDVDILGQVHQRAMETMQGLEHHLYKVFFFFLFF